MENPIHGTTVLKYPVEDKDPLTTNCAVAIRDHHRAMPGSGEHLLGFSTGSLITSVDTGTSEEGLWRGNHRGDKGMLLPSSHVRLLTKDEMEFVSDLKTSQRLAESQAAQKILNFHTHILDIKSDYRVIFDFSPDMQPTTIVIEPLIKSLRSYRLACQTPEDLEMWYHVLHAAHCLPKSVEELSRSSRYRRGCTIC
jgi:hypothetical protein